MEIDTLQGVQVGGITQWIRVRGADASNPVLLLMQQGPGLPIINDAPRLEHLLGLEKAFTVVYWDQRGTGLSSPPLRTNPDRFAGMDIDIAAAEDNAYAFALDAARQRGNRRAIRQLEAIGPPPHTTVKQFTTRARWVANFGGLATNANINACSARCSSAWSARPTTPPQTSSAPFAGSARHRLRCCPNSPPQT